MSAWLNDFRLRIVRDNRIVVDVPLYEYLSRLARSNPTLQFRIVYPDKTESVVEVKPP